LIEVAAHVDVAYINDLLSKPSAGLNDGLAAVVSNEGECEMKMGLESIRAFVAEEDGVALTEYLILLALLVGGVVAAVGLAGDGLAGAWSGWTTWWGTLTPPPAA
jgi:pilus assembly protein Flp/PilA